MIRKIFLVCILLSIKSFSMDYKEFQNVMENFIKSKVNSDSVIIKFNKHYKFVENIKNIEKISLISNTFKKQTLAKIIYYDKNSYKHSSLIVFRPWIYKKVLIAKENIKKEEYLSDSKVQLTIKNIVDLNNDYIASLEDVNDKISIIDIKEGEVIRKRYLKKVPLVNKFSTITVFFRKGRITIKYSGYSLGEGYKNDIILYKSMIDKQVKKGIVIAYNSVLALN